MIGSRIGAALVVTGLFAGGCAIAPADEAESTGAGESAMTIIHKTKTSLQLQATVHRVATASGAFGIKEMQYLSFHVTNVGTVDANPSYLVISCALAQAALNFSAQCTTPVVVGLPAINAGGFFDYSWPNRAVPIGAGTDSNVWVPSGMSLSETITAQLQSSTQLLDTALGTVQLADSCTDNASCAAIPTAPSPPPGSTGLLGTKLQFGYFYTSVTPTSASIYAIGPDAQLLGTTPVHGGETAVVNVGLLVPGGTWSYSGKNEPVQIYVDNALAATVVAPGTGPYAAASVVLPPYDLATHTIKATFAGDGALTPTVSRVMSFTLVP